MSSATILSKARWLPVLLLNTQSFLSLQRPSRHAAKQVAQVWEFSVTWIRWTNWHMVLDDNAVALKPSLPQIHSEYLQCKAMWWMDSTAGQLSHPLWSDHFFWVWWEGMEWHSSIPTDDSRVRFWDEMESTSSTKGNISPIYGMHWSDWFGRTRWNGVEPSPANHPLVIINEV